MKIAFFGLKQAFDYLQIGGVESFIRRFATQLVQAGHEVDYILYGDNTDKVLTPLKGLTLRYFKSFDSALNAINGEYAHVITIYLLPKKRLKYALFRKKYNKSTMFHFIVFSWPDSAIKRNLSFAAARLFPYNGKIFCISQRQYEYIKSWAKNAVYILPPVPENYFLKPEEKLTNEKIKITFLGRIDIGKGINEVIEIFKSLRAVKSFECLICGIHIPEDKRSMKIHQGLRHQEDIKYIEIDRQRYSPAIDDFTRKVFGETDILIQPYQRLSSSIDTPLILLEAMASLCAVITKPFGNIPEIYGDSEFLLPHEGFISNAIGLLKNITVADLVKERARIYGQCAKLNFRSEHICHQFLTAINESNLD